VLFEQSDNSDKVFMLEFVQKTVILVLLLEEHSG